MWYFRSNTPPSTINVGGATWAQEFVQQVRAGGVVNRSEGQAATHQEQRSKSCTILAATADILSEYDHIIHIGIGGSELGPRLVHEALASGSGPRLHWLSDLDDRAFATMTQRIPPSSRVAIVMVSKSFTTQETLTWFGRVRDFIGNQWADHTWVVTAYPERARVHGILVDHILRMPVTVGGRYSLWGPVSVSVAAAVGQDIFDRMLGGAARSDHNHLQGTGLSWQLADTLLDWSKHQTIAVVSYDLRVRRLGEYLSQLIMESLGKSVSNEGKPLDSWKCPVILPVTGTRDQHSIFQCLHQGRGTVPAIMVGSVRGPSPHHTIQLSHLMAQAQVLNHGVESAEPHRVCKGNRPVGVLLTEQLTPESLGYLLASWENAVIGLAGFLGINPFDQWGVEQGKIIAGHAREVIEQPGFGWDNIEEFVFGPKNS